MNAAIFAASLMPFADSTPLDTSTAQGRTRRIASPTFSRVSPPERTSGWLRSRRHQRPVETLSDSAVLLDVAVEQPAGRAGKRPQVF